MPLSLARRICAEVSLANEQEGLSEGAKYRSHDVVLRVRGHGGLICWRPKYRPSLSGRFETNFSRKRDGGLG